MAQFRSFGLYLRPFWGKSGLCNIAGFRYERTLFALLNFCGGRDSGRISQQTSECLTEICPTRLLPDYFANLHDLANPIDSALLEIKQCRVNGLSILDQGYVKCIRKMEISPESIYPRVSELKLQTDNLVHQFRKALSSPAD